ncbi:MAG: nuclear transport factor 2 family protein [Polyangiaceae bacterium]
MRKPLSAVGSCLFMLVACAPQEPAVAPLAAPPPAQPAPVAAATQPITEAPKEAAKPVELTAEQGAKLYADCWTSFNDKDWAKFGGCFNDTATSEQVDMGPAVSGKDVVDKGAKVFATAFPDSSGEAQLTLVNGSNIAGVWLMRGTQKGPLATPGGDIAATNKRAGYLLGHVVEIKGGKAQREQAYYDAHTLLGQLGVAPGPVRKVQEQGAAEKPVVIATGNDAEKANVEVYKKYTEAFNKHDAAGVEALLTDDFVYSDQSAPADLVGKKEAQKGMKDMWKGFSDAKIEATTAWAAGDYIVSQGTFSGTNDGPIPSMKLYKKTGKHAALGYLTVAKLAGGKLKQQWLFTNGMAFAGQLGLLPPPAKDAKAKDGKPGPEKGPIGAADKPGSKPGAPGATPPGAKPGLPPPGPAAAGPGAPAAGGAAKPATPPGPGAAPAAPKAAAPATPKPGAAPAAPGAAPAPAKPAAPATPAKPATPPAAAPPKPAPAPAPAK